MKKIIKAALALAIGFMSFGASAQEMPQLPQMPRDTAVVYGVLPNGLTYYIRHNEYPKGQADFRIAQKVGSVLEEDNQRGLAHFLEHMCFNGTKNYPGNSLVTYLESIGVKFGRHLNAYTGTDETVYMVTNVPTARTEVTDSVLLVLHDWANELLLDPAEIDKERGVIHEEWRTSNTGQMRILEQLLPTIYPGSRYAYRLPIGTMEVVDHFPYQALRDYYEKWYRPDLQGIIVVGDIDTKRTEEVIKKMFSDIEMPSNAAPRTEFPVPDTPGTIYAIGADKEMPQSVVILAFKHDVMPKELRNTPAYYMNEYANSIIDMMLNERYQDIAAKPDAPFAQAGAEIGSYILSNTKDMLAVQAVAKDNNVAGALESVYREVLRAARGGFTQGEYDRAKAEFMAGVERRFNNRNTTENGTYTERMVRSFLDGTPLAGEEIDKQVYQQISQMLPLQAINEQFKEMVTDSNRVVLCMLPETATLPTEQQLADMMKSVDAETIEALKDDVRQDPLIPSLAAAGTITKTEPLKGFEGTESWTLSNGAKVYVKKTGFKADEIVMTASAPGGLSQVYTTATPADGRVIPYFSGSFGIGAYSSTDLQKYLAGKKVGIEPGFSLYSTSIKGNTTPKDLPTLMELVYGVFTSMNFNNDDFESTRAMMVSVLENQQTNPQFVFGKDLLQSIYKSPYMQQVSVDDIKNATREGVTKLTRSRMTDASQWTFTFVGNVDTDSLRALCEKYIASLPSTGKGAKRITKADAAYEINAGTETSTFTTAMKTPQTYCAIINSATMDYTPLNINLTSITGQILTARLLKTVREDMGAVYSISASGDIDPYKGRNMQVMSMFPMNPEKKDEVLKVISNEFESMAREITPEELNKVKEYMVKTVTEQLENNSAWMSKINNWALTGQNTMTGAVERINGIKPADVQKFVKAMNVQRNYRVVILDPQK